MNLRRRKVHRNTEGILELPQKLEAREVNNEKESRKSRFVLLGILRSDKHFSPGKDDATQDSCSPQLSVNFAQLATSREESSIVLTDSIPAQ